MSIMTTRSNAMPSPLLFSKEAEDDINGGFSRNGGVNLKPQLKNKFDAMKKPPTFPSVLDRSYNQRSDMLSMTEQKVKDQNLKDSIPKLQLTQPIGNTYNTSRAGNATIINSTTASFDDRTENSHFHD